MSSTVPDAEQHPCLITARHGAHDWMPLVVDPDDDHVLHLGLATLRCPGR